ncbi:hypothetical protein LTR29_002179 [Friedmanniomyces endolithicus]|nr:hypothetical protein LTR29_002179 [Friedmanniomyces endolithicus]
MSAALPLASNKSPSQSPGDPNTTAAIPEPEQVHIRDGTSTVQDPPDDELEASELHSPADQRKQRVSRIIASGSAPSHWYDPAGRLWRHHIRLSVPHVDCRDHLANERTFLGYLRTSLALSMLGITVAQLYRLQHSANPDAKLGYFLLSKPIAGLFQCSAICVILIGSVRFYRQQHAMSVGKVHVGGWEILSIMGLVFLWGLAECEASSSVTYFYQGADF